MEDDEAPAIGELVRSCSFAMTTAELAAAGRIAAPEAFEAISDALDDALLRLGVDMGTLARLFARTPGRSDY